MKDKPYLKGRRTWRDLPTSKDTRDAMAIITRLYFTETETEITMHWLYRIHERLLQRDDEPEGRRS